MALAVTERKLHASIFIGSNEKKFRSILDDCNIRSASGRQTMMSSLLPREQHTLHKTFAGHSDVDDKKIFGSNQRRLNDVSLVTTTTGEERKNRVSCQSAGKGNSCCGLREVPTASEASQSLLRKRGLEGILSTLEEHAGSSITDNYLVATSPSSEEKKHLSLVPSTTTTTPATDVCLRNPLARVEETYHHFSSDSGCGSDGVDCTSSTTNVSCCAADTVLHQHPIFVSDSDSSNQTVSSKLWISRRGFEAEFKRLSSEFRSDFDFNLKETLTQRQPSKVLFSLDDKTTCKDSDESKAFADFLEGSTACWQPEPGLKKLDLEAAVNSGLSKFMSPQENSVQVDGRNTSPEHGFASSPENTTSSYACGFELQPCSGGGSGAENFNLAAHGDLNHHSSTSSGSLQTFPSIDSYVPASEMNVSGIDSFPSVQQSSAAAVDVSVVTKLENGGSSVSGDSSGKGKMNKIFPWMHGSRQSQKKNQDSNKEDSNEGMLSNCLLIYHYCTQYTPFLNFVLRA